MEAVARPTSGRRHFPPPAPPRYAERILEPPTARGARTRRDGQGLESSGEGCDDAARSGTRTSNVAATSIPPPPDAAGQPRTDDPDGRRHGNLPGPRHGRPASARLRLQRDHLRPLDVDEPDPE